MSPEIGVAQASEARLTHLLDLVPTLGFKHVKVLEIGSYEGASALYWRSELARLPELGKVICVDPWLPYHSEAELSAGSIYRDMNTDLVSGDVFLRFLKNISTHGDLRVPITWFRGTLKEWIQADRRRYGVPQKFHIVYIDGDHRYSAVRQDLELARALVEEGGLICGDDLERQIELESEDEVAARANAEFDYFNSHHPGVSLAVMEVFGRVWSEEGVWAMKRVGAEWRPPK